MAMGDRPDNNVHRLPLHRASHLRGAQRVAISVTGLTREEQNRQLPERLEFPLNREQRNLIIRKQIDAVNDMRRARGLEPLRGADLSNVIAAAESAANSVTGPTGTVNTEAIMQAVVAAAGAALPDESKKAFQEYLKSKQVSEADYNAVVARYGAFPNLEAAIFAARSIGNGGSVGSVDNVSSSSANSSYPNYGGTAFRDYGSYAAYGHTRYGFNAGVSRDLWNLGVRSEAQMQQVVSDVGRIGLGAGKENTRFTNSVAADVALLRTQRGAATTGDLDHVRQHGQRLRDIMKAYEEAKKNKDEAGMATAARQYEELQRQHHERHQQQGVPPDARSTLDRLATKTEAEVATTMHPTHGPRSLEEIRARMQAARDRHGHQQDASIVARQTHLATLSPTGSPTATPSAAPSAATPSTTALERREVASVVSALDEFGGAPTATQRADAPTGTPSSVAVAASTPSGSPSATVVAQSTAGAPSGSPSATVVAHNTPSAAPASTTTAAATATTQVAAKTPAPNAPRIG